MNGTRRLGGGAGRRAGAQTRRTPAALGSLLWAPPRVCPMTLASRVSRRSRLHCIVTTASDYQGHPAPGLPVHSGANAQGEGARAHHGRGLGAHSRICHSCRCWQRVLALEHDWSSRQQHHEDGVQDSEGGTIRLETLIDLKCLNSSFWSLSSDLN